MIYYMQLYYYYLGSLFLQSLNYWTVYCASQKHATSRGHNFGSC